MTQTFVDIHILQAVPPSNINRDDTGSPKTAVYGGVRRARVSSQAWKRATRKLFEQSLDISNLGLRTKRVVEILAEEIRDQAPNLTDDADTLATQVLGEKGVGLKLTKPRQAERHLEEAKYLILVSHHQIRELATHVVTAANAGDTIDAKAARAVFKTGNSIDLALFGRMVADVSDLGVDASAQVAHAISVHAVDNEYDYYTAVDDLKQDTEDAGAGMIGTIEFNSSTLYRYATVNVNALHANLGNYTMTRRGLSAFVQSFVTSMPTGKQNTFANRTLPDAVLISLRSDQPVSLVGAFEEAVEGEIGGGVVRAAASRLAQYAQEVDAAYGNRPEATWVFGTGGRAEPLEAVAQRADLPTVLSELDSTVQDRMNGTK